MKQFRLVLFLCSAAWLAGCSATRSDLGLANQDRGLAHPDPPPPATDSISGTVTYRGAPLAGVTVTLWMTNTNAVTDTAITDSNGAYSFSGIKTTGNVPLDYHLWAAKPGYGFLPSVSSGAKVIRSDHTGQFEPGVTGTTTFGVPMYLTVIDYIALPNASLTGANFLAYDGATPLVTLAASGQIASYVAGDDGAVKKGVAWADSRFTDNQNGTVTDSLTGLTWLKDAGCLPPDTWAAALSAVNALATGTCGLSDGSAAGQWRLPNLGELESLIDVSASSPAISAGSPFVGVANGVYWTSTSYFGGQGGSPEAWAIRFSDGSYINDRSGNLKTTSLNGVWAVRGAGAGPARLQATGLYVPYQAGDDGTVQAGVPLIYPRFRENNDGTVTDIMTGLVWLKMANCIRGDWASAVAAVQTLANGQCGLSDASAPGAWRMPNRKEMQSLSDRNQNNEALYFNFTFHNPDQSVFQPAVFTSFVSSEYYWTSSTDAADISAAWTVYSCDFGVYAMSKEAAGYTLAVRANANGS